jgi:hypothetical protein
MKFHKLFVKFLNPVQSKTRVLSFDQVGWVNFYFKKIQNGVVLVKKKSTGCNRVLPGQSAGLAGSHRVMAYAIFLSTRPGSSPGSRVDPGFKTLAFCDNFSPLTSSHYGSIHNCGHQVMGFKCWMVFLKL